jgi:glycerol-3-phosphate dehydrogenase
LYARGVANGVEGLALVDESFVRAREPNVPAVAALYSPESGVVEAEALIKALLRSGIEAGAIFLPATRLRAAEATGASIDLATDRETIRARQVVNAAGLYADDVSAMLGGEDFRIYPCRGEYAELTPSKRSLVNSLVYPLPHKHGLGVHVLKTFSGAVWLGPTAVFQNRKDDYESNRLPVDAFLEPASRLIRGITIDDLRLAGSGIRPKLHGPEEAFADFLIRRDHVNPRVVQAAGIESPGLTACLAVGRLVGEIVGDFT